jgi:fructose-bisphosphate aldolase, class II
MSLVDSRDVFREAMAGRYAIGAFNVDSFEHLQAIVETAQEERSPVILAFSDNEVQYFGLPLCAGMAKIAADLVDVPVVVHLDHGPHFERVAQCIRAGFTSVMYDGSHSPFEENVSRTKQVVAMAHACGVPVEGELGTMFASWDQVTEAQVQAGMTDASGAKKFLELTGADSLAVAVGSIHCMEAQGATLDLKRIEEIRDATGAPLVLHGSSGVTNDSLVGGIERGIVKINVGTYVCQGYGVGIRKAMDASPGNVFPTKWLVTIREVMKERVREKMRLFGSSGRVTTAGGLTSARRSWGSLGGGAGSE